ncbi:keto reductase family 1 member C1 homolog [Seminavis robusta]|uniref:Keto reductase family 1 member C1 homolog n=1 Tax=Seminavis robusta TaxID=568900 RepID=A0A9N8DSZ4_9STRA|nr:keto reductase family 1 member C1 homolog [Seminavis robusta]|eukprot:Sro266_g103230.1 keto reductase family 1 member C1 homolog (396) ;mRNA; f:53032-54219
MLLPMKTPHRWFLTAPLLLLCSYLATASDTGDADDNDTSFTSGMAAQVRLHDGNTMPVLGLGVALTAEATYSAVQSSLEVGYRLIDTAAEESYGNEDAVGQAIRDYIHKEETTTITRDNVFVTTKLWDSDHGFYETLEAFDESYDTLDLGTMDLYLMHSPFGGRLIETWDAMLYAQSQGHVKSIGVSNFGIPHLQAILDSGRPLPVVNQIEMHPLVFRRRAPLIEWCQRHNVQIQAYGSLMHGYPEWLTTPQLLVDLARKYDSSEQQQVTTAQILLRWALQHDFLIIPKSSKRKRIVENAQLYNFFLSEEDMKLLDDWGDNVTPQQGNLYKMDWNWNPVDEASVHLGRTDYWPHYEGVVWEDHEYDHEEPEEGDDVYEESDEDEIDGDAATHNEL